MKKYITTILFILLTSLLYADNWVMIKTGIGNETAGAGVALELKYQELGLVVGSGIVNENIGYSSVFRVYLSELNDQLVFLSLGYGMLNFMVLEIENNENNLIETSTTYGPFLMIGTSRTWGRVLGDYSLGVGYSTSSNGAVLTVQASLGFIFGRF